MKKYRINIIFACLLLMLSLISSAKTLAIEERTPNRENIYNQAINKPVSDKYPIFMTKYLQTEMPKISKSTQVSEAGSFSDLLISESVVPATFEQRNSTLTRLSDGRTVAGWTDDRFGNQMIFIQVFDADGNLSGSNIMAIGRDDENDVSSPLLVSDGAGGFFLGWRDDATGWIYVSRFDSDLVRQAEFRISNPALGYAGLFDLALYPGGRLAAVWEQFFISSTINFRIFSSTGAPLTENITINDETSATYRAPSIAVEPSGNMAITWEDSRNGNADIYMQFVNSDGSLYGDNQRLIDFDYLTDEQFLPEIIFSSTDGYTVSWLDDRSGTQRVFLQRITRADGLIGDNVNISANIENTEDWFVSMAVDLSGDLAVSWSSIGNGDKVLLQKFSTDMTPDGAIITASDSNSKTGWEKSLEIDNNNNLYCLWSDSRRGNWDIMLKQYNSDGVVFSANDIIVNDDTVGAHSTQPVVETPIGSAIYLAAFSNKKNDAGDIYFRTVFESGQFYTDEIKLNSDNISALQKDIYLKKNFLFGTSDVIAVWVDERAINGIVGQRIFSTYIPAPYNFLPFSESLVSDSFSISPKSSPKFANSEYGSEAYAWIDYESGVGHIYSRIFDRYDNPTYWPEIKQISQSGIETDNDYMSLMAFFNGDPNQERYTHVWLSRGIENGPSVIFAQCDLTNTVVNRFSFTSDQTDIDIKEISVVGDLSGDMYLLWRGEGNGTNYLYLTVFDKTGAIIHPTYEITGGIGGVKEDIDIAVDIYNGVVATTWVDTRNSRNEVFYQIFYPDLTPFGENQPVSQTQQRYMKSPSVAMDGQQAVIAWVDARANGNNIYMTQVDYSQTDIDDFEPSTIPSGFDLKQNYPNPFNPSTTIEFALPSKSHATLEVYNLLGRKIATITHRLFESGTHTVNWNGKNQSGEQSASGVYFYRIETDNYEQTRKMILLK